MKRWIPWLIAAVLVALVVAGVLRGVASRKAAQTSAPKTEALAMEIAPGEVFVLQARQISRGIPVSGAVRAVQSATIKARVPGELQGLVLREGDAVRAGQEVARIDATETQARVRQAQQQADALNAQAAISQRQFDNNRALVAQGFISKTALESSHASLDASKANYQAAVSAVDVLRKSLADTVLRSPIDGFVAQRLVQNGERVGVDARILEVVNLQRLEVEALVPAADATQVRVGQKARLTVEGSSTPVQAQVVRISPSAQAGTRAVPVYLAIDTQEDDGAQGLRQGVFLQGMLIAGTEQALAVPLDAVRTDQPQPYLQIVDSTGHVARQTVELGARTQVDGVSWVAVSGVKPGTQVLAARVGSLPAGTALRLPATPQAPVGSTAQAAPAAGSETAVPTAAAEPAR